MTASGRVPKSGRGGGGGRTKRGRSRWWSGKRRRAVGPGRGAQTQSGWERRKLGKCLVCLTQRRCDYEKGKLTLSLSLCGPGCLVGKNPSIYLDLCP